MQKLIQESDGQMGFKYWLRKLELADARALNTAVWAYRILIPLQIQRGIHTGIDMVSSDTAVRAVADGTLYSSSENAPVLQ